MAFPSMKAKSPVTNQHAFVRYNSNSKSEFCDESSNLVLPAGKHVYQDTTSVYPIDHLVRVPFQSALIKIHLIIIKLYK